MEAAIAKHLRRRSTRLYQYVGPKRLRLAVAGCPIGTRIASPQDVEDWIYNTGQEPNSAGLIPATFVADLDGYLRVADRHSEHIACAGRIPVLSAGKIFFGTGDRALEVVEISNQSTGFCPELNSWGAVAKAIERIPLPHPGKFTSEFVFRRCPNCGELNVVQDNLFFCAVCDTDLPEVWNCDI